MIHHLGIIMDGNRRWAKKHWKLTLSWHKAGYDNAVTISELVAKKWIQYLTLWALSTENLKNRDKKELSWIISLIELIPSLIPTFKKNKSQFATIWDIEKLPKRTQKILAEMKEKTKDFWDRVTTLALVYGWQDEIIRAIKRCVLENQDIQNLDEVTFRKYTDTGRFPQPDLIIRTWGDVRHSWFLLYDCAYSEYYFSEKLWPDFDEKELDIAIDSFNKTKRNFWK